MRNELRRPALFPQGQGGAPRFDFTGQLPAAWPRTATMADGALWPFGFGLTYSSPGIAWTRLPENPGVSSAGDTRVWFSAGVPAPSWSLHVDGVGTGKQTRITTVPAIALDGRVRVTATNYIKQEGARRFAISGGSAAISIDTQTPLDLGRETNGEVILIFTAKVWGTPLKARLGMQCGGRQCGGGTAMALPVSAGFVRYGVPLRCFANKGVDMRKVSAPFILTTQGRADFAIADVRLGTDPGVLLPCR